MKLKSIVFAAVAAGLLFSSAYGAFAQGFFQPPPPPKPFPFVSPLFGDDMVLQRDKLDAIWGWSDQPGDKVTVQIGDTTETAVAQADRRWEVKIKPPAAGGPYTIKITGRETIELHNVLVGDVWLCTGQSNMLVSLREAKNGDDEVKAANYPQIRFFSVFGHAAYNHTGVIGGSWKPVTPETAARVSAVGYTSPAKFRRTSTSPSASSSTPSVEPPPKLGPAPPPSARSRISMFPSIWSTASPPPKHLNTAITSSIGTTSTTSARKKTGPHPTSTTPPGSP